MFLPEKMSFVNISVLDEHITQVLDRVTKLGVIHVVDKEELTSISEQLKDIDAGPVKNRLSALDGRIDSLMNILDIEDRFLPLSTGMEIEIDPFQIAGKLENDLSEIEAAANPVVQRRTQIQAEISDLEESSYQLAVLDAQGITLEVLRETRFLYLALGDIPKEYYNRLAESLAHTQCVLVQGEAIMNRQNILAFIAMSEKDVLSDALEAAYFSKARVPEKYHGSISDVLDQIELEIWARREEMAELQGQLRSLKSRWRSKLSELRATIAANQVVVESLGKFGKTDRSYFLSGWVPYRDVKRLQKELRNISNQDIVIDSSEPFTAQEAENHKPKVPTKFRHPFFLWPFTWLIRNFGIPRYSDIDPTLFASLAFLVMFGVMFADVGHGGVLLLMGLIGCLYPLPLLKPIRQLSAFLACCGGASMIFGFVFGNVFGKEEIIKPLWFSLENMNPDSIRRMLFFGVVFGIIILSLGILLNIIQSLRRKSFKEGFFGQWGVFSLLAYWTAVFLLITKRQFSWDKILIIVALLLPIMLREPVARLFGKNREHGEEEAEGIIESGFQIYEMVMAYLANTLSYIRMAAFNLSHAGLMMASYSLTRELGGDGNIFLSLPSNILANGFVIALEGLIVAIQCMRLEYYEFFSKFFTGEGIEYKPMKIG